MVKPMPENIATNIASPAASSVTPAAAVDTTVELTGPRLDGMVFDAAEVLW